jgi:hypothetical protein
MNMREWFWAAGLGAAILAVGGCDVIDVHAAGVDGTFERTLTVSGAVDLDVRTGSGTIQIKAGPGNSVQVIGRIRAQASVPGTGPSPEQRVAQIQAHPPVEQTGNSLRIGVTGDDPLYRNVSISYELVVPAHTKVQARSGSGDIGIALTAGDVEAKTGSGDINVLGTAGSFMAQTGSGDVHAGRIAGPMKATTGSGDIDAAQTVQGPVEMRTGSGNVTLSLSNDAAFNLNVRTGSGSIHTVHPVTVLGARRRNRLEGTVRGGGPPVDITTGSGSVTIN